MLKHAWRLLLWDIKAAFDQYNIQVELTFVLCGFTEGGGQTKSQPRVDCNTDRAERKEFVDCFRSSFCQRWMGVVVFRDRFPSPASALERREKKNFILTINAIYEINISTVSVPNESIEQVTQSRAH